MFIIRPVTFTDMPALQNFAENTSWGIANLPRHLPRLTKRLENSNAAFHSQVTKPGREVYSFILEDLESQICVGTASIMARADAEMPLCAFKLQRHHGAPHSLTLHIHQDVPSELCALYLLPSHRHGGIGKLLSLSRLLFIAAHIERFHCLLMADMRGEITPEGYSPFWEAIGERYFHCSFQEALKRLDREELELPGPLPREPILWRDLPEAAREVVGLTHPHTRPAWHLLTSEGLAFHNEVSILDGGPQLLGPVVNLATIAHSRRTLLAASLPTLGPDAFPAFICNTLVVDFRATQSCVILDTNGQVILDNATAQALHLSPGSPLLYVPLTLK